MVSHDLFLCLMVSYAVSWCPMMSHGVDIVCIDIIISYTQLTGCLNNFGLLKFSVLLFIYVISKKISVL